MNNPTYNTFILKEHLKKAIELLIFLTTANILIILGHTFFESGVLSLTIISILNEIYYALKENKKIGGNDELRTNN